MSIRNPQWRGMNDRVYSPSKEDLAKVASAQAEFREHWASFKAMPFAAPFDGTITDVEAIDYLQYEGLGLPACGVDGAALVSGEVSRRAAGMKWMIDHRGHWLLVDCQWPRVVIDPLARILELEIADEPQFEKYETFLLRAVTDYFLQFKPEHRAAVRELIEPAHFERMDRTLSALRGK